MADDDEDGWETCDAVIACDLYAAEMTDPDGFGIVAELITDEGAYRIAWRRHMADDLLGQLIAQLGRIDRNTDDD